MTTTTPTHDDYYTNSRRLLHQLTTTTTPTHDDYYTNSRRLLHQLTTTITPTHDDYYTNSRRLLHQLTTTTTPTHDDYYTNSRRLLHQLTTTTTRTHDDYYTNSHLWQDKTQRSNYYPTAHFVIPCSYTRNSNPTSTYKSTHQCTHAYSFSPRVLRARTPSEVTGLLHDTHFEKSCLCHPPCRCSQPHQTLV